MSTNSSYIFGEIKGRSFPPMGSLKTTASISTSCKIRSVKRAANSPWICMRLRTTSGWSISNVITSEKDSQLRTPMVRKNPRCTCSISTCSLDCQARTRRGHRLGSRFLSDGFRRRENFFKSVILSRLARSLGRGSRSTSIRSR